MEGNVQRMHIMLFCAIVILQSIVILFWGNIKEGYFIDELYSMEGAHNVTRLSLKAAGYKWQDQDGFFENWHDSDEFIEHITVNKEDKLTNYPIKSVANKLLKRPHYSLLNIISGLHGGTYSKWDGIVLNLILFIMAQTVLYCMAQCVTKSKTDALFVVGFYGFSAGAISTGIFIRNYMLSVLMTLLISYFHILLWNSKKAWKECAGILGILLLTYYGYQVHQYVLVYSGAVFFVYISVCALKREWSKLGRYAVCFGIAGGGYLTVKGLDSMLSGEQGVAAVHNLFHKPLMEFARDLISYVMTTIGHLFGNKYWMFILAVGLGVFLCILKFALKKTVGTQVKECVASTFHECGTAYALLAIVALYILIVGRICPWISWRYICNVYPVLVLSLFCIARVMVNALVGVKKTYMLFIAFTGVCILLSYNTKSIRELHLGAKEEARILREEYSQVDSIFAYDGDEGRLYLNSYIFAPDTEVFYTQRSQFTEKDVFWNFQDYQNRNVPDSVLLWVSAQNEDYRNTVNYFVEHSTYQSSVLLLDRSRHNECYYVYLLQK